MDGTIHIGEASRRLRVSATYLRLLEKQGKAPPARRDAFGDRVYSESDLLLLRALGVGSGRKLRTVEEALGGVR